MTSYILYRLLQYRSTIRADINIKHTEPFYSLNDNSNDSLNDNSTENQAHLASPFMEGFRNTPGLSTTGDMTQPLKQYFYKASFNTAYNNSTRKIDTKYLSTVMKRGVRWIDLEIYSIKDSAIVGYSSNLDPGNTVIESSNDPSDPEIQISNILQVIASSRPTGISDPLFIHLRIKSAKPDTYKKIIDAIEANLKSALYLRQVNGNTKLSELKDKIVIGVDVKHSDPNYESISSEVGLSSLISFLSGKETLALVQDNQLNQSLPKRIHAKDDNTITINESDPSWTFVYPDLKTQSNPDVFKLVRNQCPNIIAVRFDYDDDNLASYESLFTQSGTVLLGAVHTIANKA